MHGWLTLKLPLYKGSAHLCDQSTAGFLTHAMFPSNLQNLIEFNIFGVVIEPTTEKDLFFKNTNFCMTNSFSGP